MSLIVQDDIALHEWAYAATENYPAGTNVSEWNRTPVDRTKPGFYVEVYVEGYRPNKEIWKHCTERFDTLEQALDYRHKISNARWDDEQPILLNFEGHYGGTGIYSVSFEYTIIYEYTTNGEKFKWERKQ